jgi:UDP:flavonoid glycosyltransferase YjiC (YdhE family)
MKERLTAGELAKRIETALSPDAVRRAAELGRRIREEDGAGRATELILSSLV